MFILKNWHISNNYDRYNCYGNVYNNPRFYEGENIHTSPLLKLEEKEDGYIAHTFNSEYFLPKDAYKSPDNTQDIIAEFQARYQSAFRAAEKLLKVGDSLIFFFSVFYRTNSGIIKLEPHKKEKDLISFEYECDGFELLADIHGNYIVETATESTDNSLYILSVNLVYLRSRESIPKPNCLEKKYYRLLRRKVNTNYGDDLSF